MMSVSSIIFYIHIQHYHTLNTCYQVLFLVSVMVLGLSSFVSRPKPEASYVSWTQSVESQWDRVFMCFP